MADAVRWLSDGEQLIWRRWLALTTALPAALNRQLLVDSDLSLQDFAVLVALTDVAEERMRVTALAEELRWERSRTSHHLRRMETRGLVRKEDCADDGRGAFVTLTTDGRAAIQAAAPGHVRTVRQLVFDPLSERDVRALGEITNKLLERVEEGASGVETAV